MQQHMEQSGKAQEEIGELQETLDELTLEPKPEPKLEPKLAAQQKQPSAIGRAYLKQSAQELEDKQDMPSREFEQRYEDAESQLAFSRQSYQAEKLRANCTGFRLQTDLVSGKEAFTAHLGEFTNTDKSTIGPLLSMAPSNTFRNLEERIRSHQLQVYQDCDVLEQALKTQVV